MQQLLVGKKIKSVQTRENSKSVSIVLEDDTELIVEIHGHPGIHYDWDESLRLIVNGNLYTG